MRATIWLILVVCVSVIHCGVGKALNAPNGRYMYAYVGGDTYYFLEELSASPGGDLVDAWFSLYVDDTAHYFYYGGFFN
jgi:hypothetical protein